MPDPIQVDFSALKEVTSCSAFGSGINPGLNWWEGYMKRTFHVGQLVRLNQSPGHGEGRIYCITCVLPSEDQRMPAYLIKTMTGAERIVRPQEIKAASANAVP